jgi:hypothetical protein
MATSRFDDHCTRGTDWSGQRDRTRVIASCSAGVTQSRHRAFTATWRATKRHRYDFRGGSHVAVSPSPSAVGGPVDRRKLFDR